MTNPLPSTPTPGTPFALHALVPITVGRATIDLYPVIDQTMLPHKRAHTFHINKIALSSQSINLRIQLDAFGHQLNLSATVEWVINDWFRHFYDRWSDFSRLIILSSHGTKGDQVNDSTEGGNPSVFLPVVDGAIGTCRKNVKFIHVQLLVDIIDLVTVDNLGLTTLRIEYYIELPQSTCQMMNGNGNAYNLTTFLGTAYLRTLTQQHIQAKILLDHTLQDGPVKLQPASARTDSLAIRDKV
jgi:hypothetical protein